MAIPFGSDLYQAVSPGGTVTLTQMFETAFGSGIPQAVSGATVTVTPAAGNVPVIGPTSAGLVSDDAATYAFTWAPPAGTAPGDYLAVFSGTGPNGIVTYVQAVTVAAPPVLAPAPGAYATAAQYQSETGDTWTPTARIQAALRPASETIDRALIGARYAVDPNSMPRDPGIIAILMRATAAQVQFDLANNDPAGVKSQYSSTSVGGVSATRTASAQGQLFPPLAPRAAQILQTAGALPGSPMLGWLGAPVAQETVLGMPVTVNDSLRQPLGVVMVVKGLDESGQVCYWIMKTPDITHTEAVGMLVTASDEFRVVLTELARDMPGDENG